MTKLINVKKIVFVQKDFIKESENRKPYPINNVIKFRIFEYLELNKLDVYHHSIKDSMI